MFNCKFCNKEVGNKGCLVLHERYCSCNPDRDTKKASTKSEKWYEAMRARRGKALNEYTKARLLGLPIPHYEVSDETRKKLSEHNKSGTPEVRAKISEGMKKAHREGRHKGWANTRKNRYGMSYPEKWFSEVIQNEFLDKNYEYNLPVGHYKLDFAWPEKARYIEIDGSQHNDTKEYDQNRDAWIKSLGWECLRVQWQDICNNSKGFIEIAKRFIDDASSIEDLNIECLYNRKVKKPKRDKSIWVSRKNLILSSGVDLTKFGCLTQLEKATGLTRRQIKLTMDKFNIEYKSHS